MTVFTLKAGTWPWLLRHEIRLAWRNTGGTRVWILLLGGAILWGAMHLAAWALIVGAEAVKMPPRVTVIFGFLTWLVITLIFSQAMMMSVSALFDRGDFDLLLSSPLSPRTVFTVRGMGIAFSVTTIYFLLLSPFAHVGLLSGKFRLMAIYPALISLGLFVTALAMLFTLSLVRIFGARRARVIAQLLGAFAGATFFLLSQAQTMLGSNQRAQIATVTIKWMEPGGFLAPDSALWFPLRAFLGETIPLLVTVIGGAGAFWLVMQLTYRRFLSGTQESVTGSATKRNEAVSREESARYFRPGLMRNVLVKEWRLILRDPNLIAQTLLQVLYLLPLFFVVSRGGTALGYVVPGAVLLGGSLAGSLAWLTVAAEDAPELVGSAPVSAARVRLMKALAAMIPAWIFVLPIFLALLWYRPWWSLAFLVCVMGSTASAGAMQVLYPRKADRKDMKRRGKNELLVSLLEGITVFGWSGVAYLLTRGPGWIWWLVPVALVLALSGPVFAWAMGKARREQGLYIADAKA
jgi:ABC-2 type transport system permease protein